MTAALAPSSWPAPAAARPVRGWRFGRPLEGAGPAALQWVLKRNCSVTPRQLIVVYASLTLVSLGIAAGFWTQGVRLIGAFAAAELALVGLALVVFARHATDRETITLNNRELAVEHRFGRAADQTTFRAEWVRVEPGAGERSLVHLSGQGRRALVGRYIRPELRADLAQELRLALRRSHEVGGSLRASGLADERVFKQ
jgi:uncharacterized membrane protein